MKRGAASRKGCGSFFVPSCLNMKKKAYFGKKEKPKPTATTTMFYTLNSDRIAWQQAIISVH